MTTKEERKLAYRMCRIWNEHYRAANPGLPSKLPKRWVIEMMMAAHDSGYLTGDADARHQMWMKQAHERARELVK